jgi:hypothetical protein
LNVKEIFLTKLNSVLNPQFDKKIIWALMTFGFLLIGYQNIVNFITSFEFKYKDLFLKLSLENEADLFSKIIGIVFVLISSYFFYAVFIKDKDKTKFKTLKEASCSIKKVLDDNKRIFIIHGPNSSSNSVTNIKTVEQLSIWDSTKKDKIVPNNEKVYSILENIEKYEENEIDLVADMKSHIEAFKEHVSKKNVDYSQHQFPIKFSILITKYCNNGLLKDKYINHYTTWIKKYISDNNIQNIQNKYLFGSVLYDAKPNDIDVLLYLSISDVSELLVISKLLNKMEQDFKLCFDKNLHQTVFSVIEKQKFDDFKYKLLDTKEF